MTQILAIVETPGQCTVTWERQGKRHLVRYGKQVTWFSGKDSCVTLAEHFGLCVRHAVECAGELDDYADSDTPETA